MNTNNQIQLITYSNDDVRVSTLEIAKHTRLNHQGIIKLIRRYIERFNRVEQVRFEISLNKQGSPTEYALLTERQVYSLYNLFRNISPEVVDFKFNLADRFYELKQMVLNQNNAEWLGHRQSGKIISKRLNDLFDKALDVSGKPHESRYFIGLQQSIYKSALGKTFQRIRKERNIPKNESVRDHLTIKELERINLLQSLTELMLKQYDTVTDGMIHTAIHNAGNQLQSIANTKLMIGGAV